jgi:hypothetical protein
MFSFLSQIEFLNLSGLALGLAAPLLILAYLRTQSKKPIVVSSIFILNSLSKKPVIRKRVKLPPRFFVELLALLLLALAAAAPAFLNRSEHTAILIDNSLSMMAKLDANSFETRFDKAIQTARTTIEKSPSNAVFSIYRSSPVFEALLPEKTSSANAVAKLLEIKPITSEDSIDAALRELVEKNEFQRVVVLTDKFPVSNDVSEPPEQSSKERTTKVEVVQIGAPLPNYFISSLSLFTDSLFQDRKKIRAVISNSAAQGAQVRAVLSTVSLSDPEVQSLQKVIEEKPLLLNENDMEVVFNLPVSKAFPLFRLQLQAIDNNSANQFNSIVQDDVAWVSEQAAASSSVLLISPELPLQELGLEKIPGFELQRVTPLQYQQLSDKEKSRFSLMIFHKSAPTEFPSRASLLILPPVNNGIFPISEETNQPRITSWAEDHPITSYLRVALLSPGPSALIQVPLWARAVINSEFGPLIAAGEKQGTRVAVSGMELLPFEGSKTPSVSILTLNMINWLSKTSNIGQAQLTGSTTLFRNAESWLVIRPDGGVDKVSAEDENETSYRLTYPGRYLITFTDDKGEKKSNLLIANSFFPAESSSAVKSYVPIPRVRQTKDKSALEGSNAWKLLILLACLFLFVEFVMRFKRIGEATA